MVLVCVSFVVSIREMMYRTSELIKKIIIRAWSWKAISSSMIGDAAFCRPNWAGAAIKIYRCLVYDLTLTKLRNYFTNTLLKKS